MSTASLSTLTGPDLLSALARMQRAGQIFPVCCDGGDEHLYPVPRAASVKAANTGGDDLTARREAAMKQALERLPLSAASLSVIGAAAVPAPVKLDADGKPESDLRAKIAGQEARRAARAEVLKLVRAKMPAADYGAVWDAARAHVPVLFT